MFLENTQSEMFDRVLNIVLDYLSYFTIILRGIYGNVDICQTDYNIPCESELSPYSEIPKSYLEKQQST